MRSICLYFQVHQPYRLRTYRFFDIGEDHQYYDEYQNRQIIRRAAEKCYLPANKMLLDLIKEFGPAFKVSFCISGTAMDQFRQSAPEVLHSFRRLADTGSVEFLAETYAHSFAALRDKEEFSRQINLHVKAIQEHFGKTPVTFKNPELLYSDTIGEMVYEQGFSVMVTEGAKFIMGWKSPNYMYCNNINPKLKLLLRNNRLSDDIAFRFSRRNWSEWPLTTEKFTGWLNKIDPKEEVVNIFMDYEAIGERQGNESGIFEFFYSLPKAVLKHTNFTFSIPSEIAKKLQPVSAIRVESPISWADEERDLTSWLGNELQDEAFTKLYSVSEKIRKCSDPAILRDWLYLQTCDHFYFMSTKWFSDGAIHPYFNPYPSPYEAFINYMNVLSDFTIRLESDIAYKEKIITRAEPVPKRTRIKKVAPKKEPELPAIPARSKEKKKVKSAVQKFGLEDIPALSDRRVREMIKQLEVRTLAYALRGSGKETRKKIEKNLGKRALKEFRDLYKETGDAKPVQINEAQKEILKLIS